MLSVAPIWAAPAGKPLPWPETQLDIALDAELSRSTGALQESGYPAPYYADLRVSDAHFEDYHCSLGGLRYKTRQDQRLLTTDVHVGSFKLDNHPMVPSNAYDIQELPMDGDVFALRHAIWQEMDAHYKAATADFLRKEALRVERGKTEYDTDDWTREEPLILDASGLPDDPKAPEAASPERLCERLSDVFRKDPSLLNPRVTLEINAVQKRFFDSAGSRVRTVLRVARLDLEAEAMTTDGIREFGARDFIVPRISDLPPAVALEAASREITEDLDALRSAVSTSPISAPALVDPSVGAAILEAFATRLSGEQQRNPEGAQTFRGEVGKRVLPSFLSLVDDPAQVEFKGSRLVGHYEVDDQGVPAQAVVLVEHGVLRHYLLSRYPVVGFDRSNGHGRATAGHQVMGRSGNLFLKADGGLTQARLLDRLRRTCRSRGKPFGLWIRKARSWQQQDTTSQQQAFRLLPTLVYLVDARTGERTLVRDLDMVGTPLALLGQILAVGDDAAADHAYVEDASGGLPVSVVTPSLLLQEVELQRSEIKPEKPPILPPPSPLK